MSLKKIGSFHLSEIIPLQWRGTPKAGGGRVQNTTPSGFACHPSNGGEFSSVQITHRWQPTLLLRLFTFFLFLPLLSACGGGGGETNRVLPSEVQATVSNYSGPAASTSDIQQFKLNVWDNLVGNDRCGKCHGSGGQTPNFVRSDDINLAYQQATPLVNLTQPTLSKMVTKVGGGHNCWLASPSACADILTTWIAAWAGGSIAGSTTVDLRAPTIFSAGTSKSFPESSTYFAQHVYPLLTQYCAGCHQANASVPQSPFFASSDVDTAYQNVLSKIDLDTPAQSRLVLRLGQEFHNCWSDCTVNAKTMSDAITAMANQIQPTPVDPKLLISKALKLTDGLVASQGGRFETHVIANYAFKTGEGSTAYDTSGVEPALNLTFSGDVQWVGGWGIRIVNGKAQGSTVASKKLHQLITATGEYSIEAWVAPGNVTQEEAVIVGYSGSAMQRNFTLGQTLYNYDFLNRSKLTNAAATPALSTDDDDEVLQATQQHVVVTYDPTHGRQIYVNGEFTGAADGAGSSLADWDDSFALVLGNEVSNNHLWQGTIRFLAIHNRALSLSQVQQNYNVGVGQKYFLLFQVSDMVQLPESYIVFEVSEFDSYSYLFNKPFFISLQAGVVPGNVALKGMRIGINGQEATVGQAYANLDTALTASNYGDKGQSISSIGTIINLQKGPQSDEFFLTFDHLGTQSSVRTAPASPIAATPVDLDPQPLIGIRHFDEINASFAALTGVSSQQASVLSTYNTVKQQLPTTENIEGFVAAQQMAITQLAIKYCAVLVDDPTLSASFFSGINLNAASASAFDNAGSAQLMSHLHNKLVGSNLTTQPSNAELTTELNTLINTLKNNAASTKTIAKASCATVLGSASSLLQ